MYYQFVHSRIVALSHVKIYKDPKSRLQELVQSQQLPLPEYTVIAMTGPEHQHQFKVEVRVALLPHVVIGQGKTRRHAEQDAATQVLEELGDGI